jgi:hypothetical protein
VDGRLRGRDIKKAAMQGVCCRVPVSFFLWITMPERAFPFTVVATKVDIHEPSRTRWVSG